MKKYLFFLFVIIFMEIFCAIACYAESEEPNIQESYEDLKSQYKQLKGKYNALLREQTNASQNDSSVLEESTEISPGVDNTTGNTSNQGSITPLLWLIIVIEFIVIRVKSRKIKKTRNQILGKATNALIELEEKAKEKEKNIQNIDIEIAQKQRYLEEVEKTLTQYKSDSGRLEEIISEKSSEVSVLDNREKELEELNGTIEKRTAILSSLEAQIKDGQEELDQLKSILKIKDIDGYITEKKAILTEIDNEFLIHEYGLYQSAYDFEDSITYEEELVRIRNDQKKMVQDGEAFTELPSDQYLTENKQKKWKSDIQKILLRSFNIQCEAIINKLRYTNYGNSYKKIHDYADTVSQLGKVLGVSISESYIESKIEELRLAFEYQQKKKEERDKINEAKAAIRENIKVQEEIDRQRKILEKDRAHYENAYSLVDNQLDSDPGNEDLLTKKKAIENHINEIEKKERDLDYREANQKAGYVYIISNIGSFGKDVFKIGMTRRLDPKERVYELSDASVPFNFDIHAMIFSEDAPALEAALHKEFDDKKVNMVNKRREFFHVSLDEIKNVILQKYDNTAEFTDIPEAAQYHMSEQIRASIGS